MFYFLTDKMSTHFRERQRQEDYALFKNYFNFLISCGSVYVEIGAFDGLRINNNNFLAETLNWTGMLIEAQPDNVKEQSIQKTKCNQSRSCLPRKRNLRKL